MRSRLTVALAAYVVLGMLAFFTLSGNIQIFTIIFLAALALRTWVVALREGQEEREDKK